MEKKTLAIVGGGDLGRQIAHYAIEDKHYKKVCFFDDFTQETKIDGHLVLGGVEDIKTSFENNYFDELIIGIGYKHLAVRCQLFDEMKQNGILFGTIIHSSSWVDITAKIGVGSVIYPNCTIDAQAIVNENTILNIACAIAHDTIIGNHCFLSPRVAIAGFTKINDSCIIGINSTIIDNINICSETQVGAGGVVIKNITTKGLYVGNPVRFIR